MCDFENCGCFIVPLGHKASYRFSWLPAEGDADLGKSFVLCFWKRRLRYLHLPEFYGSDLIEGDPLRTRFQRIKQKGYLDDSNILF